MNTPNLNSISPAALAALATIARLSEADRTSVLRAHAVALGPRLWRPSDDERAPTLTALAAERDRDAIYASDVWAADYRWASTLIAYVLQAPGLAHLSARLGGISLVKAGTGMLDKVERRATDLGRDEYGALHRGVSGYQRAEGFGRFLPATRLQLAPQHARSPVRLGLYGVEVGLPAGLSQNRFESEFNRRMLPLRLHVFADTVAGRNACARSGIGRAELTRYYRRGSRHCAATELTLLRPQADCGALARLCADVIIDHVLGLLARRSGR